MSFRNATIAYKATEYNLIDKQIMCKAVEFPLYLQFPSKIDNKTYMR